MGLILGFYIGKIIFSFMEAHPYMFEGNISADMLALCPEVYKNLCRLFSWMERLWILNEKC